MSIIPFTYEGRELRFLADENGEPEVVAADLAQALGHRDAANMCRAIDGDERGTHLVSTPSGDQEMTVLTEAGMYQAILQRQTGRMADPTQKAAVKAFQRWVTHEVIPAIRKTGSYGAAPALQGPELIAAALVEADRTLRAREARIEAQAATIAVLEPKASAWDLWMSTNADYSVRQVAAALHHAGAETIDLDDGKPHVMGQNNLLRWLRLHEWVAKKSTVPNKTAIDTHRMTVRLGNYVDAKTGEQRGTSTPRITVKGAVDLATCFGVFAEAVAEYLVSDDEAVA
jgi:prophage antirepressor-like protein